MDRALYNILAPHASWFNDKGEKANDEAKLALYRFHGELIKRKPAEIYEKTELAHTSYLFYLLHIRQAFEQKLYMRACNEIVSLMYDVL